MIDRYLSPLQEASLHIQSESPSGSPEGVTRLTLPAGYASRTDDRRKESTWILGTTSTP